MCLPLLDYLWGAHTIIHTDNNSGFPSSLGVAAERVVAAGHLKSQPTCHMKTCWFVVQFSCGRYMLTYPKSVNGDLCAFLEAAAIYHLLFPSLRH